jgi:hypothetical protein
MLRMKCRLLRLQISDHRIKPFNSALIASRQEYSLVMLDLFVEFVALVTHGTHSNREPSHPSLVCLMANTAGMGICSPVLCQIQQGGAHRRRDPRRTARRAVQNIRNRLRSSTESLPNEAN